MNDWTYVESLDYHQETVTMQYFKDGTFNHTMVFTNRWYTKLLFRKQKRFADLKIRANEVSQEYCDILERGNAGDEI